ncbi:LysR substrate-binding domain-containing protein [Agarivorans sp. MS3-6]|uniref:LysR family transcriptional regulator n=1 Tax=Agarivorans sp. TSD2052 TaxID=2937286 RepID=UPI00200D46E8|nr:LysR family transcriptional regulator [Agarivorans sp. TSD2052]UPW18532.1 LysR substrate-binding domain-containing protein [Agarivorans sp. TSD2052]
MDKLRALHYFAHLAESGSFTQTAEAFSVPPSSVSRRISDLEALLKQQLLQRSTRQVKLTELGALYYQQILPALHGLSDAEDLLKQQQQHPSGMLSISAMPSYGELCLAPVLNKFSQLYPDIILDLHFSDQLSNLRRDQIDIAIRGGKAPDERIVAKRLSENRFVLCASPKYLALHGQPTSPEELNLHPCLRYRSPELVLPWLYKAQQQWQELQPPIRLISNHGATLVNAALAGEGIALLPEWGISEQLAQGSLVKFDVGQDIRVSKADSTGIYLLYQGLKYQIPKIRVAVNFLLEQLPQY